MKRVNAWNAIVLAAAAAGFALADPTTAQAAGGEKPPWDIPALSSPSQAQTSITLDVCAGPSGAGNGFIVQWMTESDYLAVGWSDLQYCYAVFQATSNSRFPLGPNDCASNPGIVVGAFQLEPGLVINNSPSCEAALLCGTTYAFHAFAIGGTEFQRSDFTPELFASTAACNTCSGVDGDQSSPAIEIDGCPETVLLGSTSSIAVAVTDSGSGVAYQSMPDGPAALDTSSVGDKVLSVVAEDNCGNAGSGTCSYRVIYDFTGAGGFQSPMHNPPTVNTAKAGSTIPVKFQLPDGHGGFLCDLTAVASVHVQQVSCVDFQYLPTDPVDPAIAAGDSGLHCDTGQYGYNWKTAKAQAGNCYDLILTLNDSSSYFSEISLQ